MTDSPQIRRIRETDADAVVELWDRMGREVRDGGPLTDAGRRNLARMLAMTAWHRDTFCLVATDGDEVVGFALGRIDIGDGLLPEVVGEIQEVYAPAGLRLPLVEAVIGRLRADGAPSLRTRVAADEPEEQEFWAAQGFEADMVVMSRYDAMP